MQQKPEDTVESKILLLCIKKVYAFFGEYITIFASNFVSLFICLVVI